MGGEDAGGAVGETLGCCGADAVVTACVVVDEVVVVEKELVVASWCGVGVGLGW